MSFISLKYLINTEILRALKFKNLQLSQIKYKHIILKVFQIQSFQWPQIILRQMSVAEANLFESSVMVKLVILVILKKIQSNKINSGDIYFK